MMPTKVHIGNDHAGFKLKQHCVQALNIKGYEVVDHGTNSTTSVDYPDFIYPVALSVQRDNKNSLGVAICGSGNGAAITANKLANIRAALCWDLTITQLARAHNDANIICLPSRFLLPEQAIEMLHCFLSTPFESGRHIRRINKIASAGWL